MSIKHLQALTDSLPRAFPPAGSKAAVHADAAFAKALAAAQQPGGDGAGLPQATLAAEMLRLQMLQGALFFDESREEDFLAGMPAMLLPPSNNYPQSQKVDRATAPLRDISPPLAPVRESSQPPATLPGPVRVAEGTQSLVDRASRRYGVEPALIKAVIKAESSFDPKAVSPVGAQGLMQLMPGTARDLGVSDPLNAEQNVMGGTRYLKQLLDKYDGQVDKALAAYNWGPGNVDRRGLATLPRETRDYLVKVKNYYDEYSS